ncbi:MAG: hypothetical protein K1X44_07210 [Alphaproteobacteria bacterium]|nr:hypothetical protein [Alphaproteobacteria bacterium]
MNNQNLPDDNDLRINLAHLPAQVAGPKITNDEKATRESEDLDRERTKQDLGHQRSAYRWILGAVLIWLILVMTIIFLTGFDVIHLSDAVMIALLTTTTANVIAMLWAIIKYLFKTN